MFHVTLLNKWLNSDFLCYRVSWNCHFISYISQSMLCSIAFKLKYYLPGTWPFSIFGTDGTGYQDFVRTWIWCWRWHWCCSWCWRWRWCCSWCWRCARTRAALGRSEQRAERLARVAGNPPACSRATLQLFHWNLIQKAQERLVLISNVSESTEEVYNPVQSTSATWFISPSWCTVCTAPRWLQRHQGKSCFYFLKWAPILAVITP